MKYLLKKARALVLKKEVEEAKKLLPQVYKALDKAAKTGLIKKNTANRKKSRITKLITKPSRRQGEVEDESLDSSPTKSRQ